jgi:enoyl-[acyl-carrier protein] reductase I
MKWVFILGGSSGFGLATAKLFAEKGYNIFIVHRDRKAALKEVENDFEDIRKKDVLLVSVNTNALIKDGRILILEKLKETLGANDKIDVFLHSIADGNIKQIVKSYENLSEKESLTEEDYQHTVNAMGISFITWSKLLFENNFFSKQARIIGITSEGSQKVISGYSAVGAAKSVLESACRYLAIELAQFGITTNLINAGVTDTAALRAIPNYEKILAHSKLRNPFNRLTCPEDVAKVIYLLSSEYASWINGEIIRVDGGEQLTV